MYSNDIRLFTISHYHHYADFSEGTGHKTMLVGFCRVCPEINSTIFHTIFGAEGFPFPDFSCKKSLQWRHNERDGVSNHQPHDYLLDRLFRGRSKNAWKLRATCLCEGNSPVTGEFPTQRASSAENVSIWWRHHVVRICVLDLIFIIKNRSYES